MISQSKTDLKVGIVGCRKFNNYNLFKQKIQEWQNDNEIITVIVSGGASGADTLAEKYAAENGIQTIIHKPDWGKHGRSAGVIRNTDIVNDSDKIIAFPSDKSVGTWDTVRKAKKTNKDVTIYKI